MFSANLIAIHTGSPTTNISPKIWARKHLPGPGVHSLDGPRDERASKAWVITTLRRENARRCTRKLLEVNDIDTLAASITQENNPETRPLGPVLAHISRDYRNPLLLQIIDGFRVPKTAEEMNLRQRALLRAARNSPPQEPFLPHVPQTQSSP